MKLSIPLQISHYDASNLSLGSMKLAIVWPVIGSLEQCDQIGRFLKVLGNKFANKSSPKKISDLWVNLKRQIDVKTAMDII